MLARIVEYWYDVIVNHSVWYIKQCSELADEILPDLPNLLTFTDVMDLLSLLNIMEFGSILWGERYNPILEVPASDLEAYSRAREHGEAIVMWFEQHWRLCSFSFQDDGTDMEMRGTVSIRAVRTSYLIQQACTLLRQAKECKRPSVKAVREALHADF